MKYIKLEECPTSTNAISRQDCQRQILRQNNIKASIGTTPSREKSHPKSSSSILDQTNNIYSASLTIGPKPTNKRRKCNILSSFYKLVRFSNIFLRHRKLIDSSTGLPSSKKAASKWRNGSKARENLDTLIRNWSATSLFLRLIYGNINLYEDQVSLYPNNRRILCKYIKMVLGLIFNRDMKKKVGNVCHDLRRKAFGIYNKNMYKFKNRGKEEQQLFIASTLTRAIRLPKPSKEDVDREVSDAFIRLTEEKEKIQPDVLFDIKEFINREKCRKLAMFRSFHFNLDNGLLPNPGLKSTINANSKKGGCSEILSRYSAVAPQPFFDRLAFTQNNNFTPWDSDAPMNFSDPVEKTGEGPELNELTHEVHDDAELYEYELNQYLGQNKLFANLMLGREQFSDDSVKSEPLKEVTTSSIFEQVLERSADPIYSTTVYRAQVFPLILPEGKIRVPTMHTSEVVWAARTLNQYLLPFVKNWSISRDIIRNTAITLENRNCSGKLHLFSADFKKSTDPISLDTAKYVLEHLTKGFSKPSWFDKVVSLVFAPHELSVKGGSGDMSKPVTCGALMGLGPSWTILSILNAFCAKHTDIRSFKTCGDDLIGLWTEEEIKIYKENVTKIKLLLNDTKCFKSRNYGVFCERFVKRIGRKAIVTESIRLSQATGMRSIDKKKGVLVSDDLYKLATQPRGHFTGIKLVRAVRNTCLQTSIRLARGNKRYSSLPGLFSQGGSGVSKANERTVLSYLLHGSVNLTVSKLDEKERKMYQQVKDEVRKLKHSGSKGVSVKDALINIKSCVSLSKRWHSLNIYSTGVKSYRLIEENLKKRLKEVKELQKLGGIDQIIQYLIMSNTRVYVRDLTTIQKKLSFLVKARKYNLAINLIQKSWNYQVLPESIKSVMESHSIKDQTQFNLNLNPTSGSWSSKGG